MKLMSAAHEVGEEKSALAERTRAKVDYIYTSMFPSMISRLKEMANSNGESTRRGSNAGRFARMLFELEDYSEAIAIHYDLLESPSSDLQNPSLEEMMNQIPLGDSVLQ